MLLFLISQSAGVRCPAILSPMAIIALSGPLCGVAADQPQRVGFDAPAHWRTGPYCGVNAAYAFLKLSGRDDVSYETIERQIPVCSEGSSLLEVKNCLRHAGIDAVAVRSTPDKLYRIPKPVIALFDPDESQAFDNDARGHFVVVISASPVLVRYVDATSAVIRSMPSDQFIRNWSGVLVARNDYEWCYGSLSIVAMSALMCICILVARKVLTGRVLRAAPFVFTPGLHGE